MNQQSNPMEPVDHLCSVLRSVQNLKKNRSRRNKRTKQQYDEDMFLVKCLVDLAQVTVPLPEPNVESKKVAVEQVPSSSSPHTCKVCKKSFKSGQALGGHISSHKQKKPVDVVPDQDRLSHQADHKCSVCGERFETGQALGGHMRKHYNQLGVMIQTGDDADAEKGRVVRDLDLNLPAPEYLLFDEPEIPFPVEETSPN